MTNAARDERERGLDVAPLDDWTRTPDGGWRAGPAGPGFETVLYEPDTPTDVTFYSREQIGLDEVRWTPITDPAEIAAIEAALIQGLDPPYEVWVEQGPAARAPGDLTPTLAEEGPTVDAWEQTGPAIGEGQVYEVTDPVVIAADAEGHPLAPTHGSAMVTPVADADVAHATDPALYDAQIAALVARGDPWLEVEQVEDGFTLGRYDAGPIERDTNGWEPVRVGDGPDDGPLGAAYPDEATARQAAIAYNGADLAGTDLTLDPAPVATLDHDLTPALDL